MRAARASGILKQYGKGRAGRTHCEWGGGGCRFLCCQGLLEAGEHFSSYNIVAMAEISARGESPAHACIGRASEIPRAYILERYLARIWQG